MAYLLSECLILLAAALLSEFTHMCRNGNCADVYKQVVIPS